MSERARLLVELHPDTIEAVARRVAEILRAEPPPETPAPALSADEPRYFGNDGGRLVDAAQLASRLGVERSWIYEHAAELGALRLGDGPRARLRFDLGRVVERLTFCPPGSGSEEPADGSATRIARPRRPARAGTGAPLLPIRSRGDARAR
jgi:hypothetical protein